MCGLAGLFHATSTRAPELGLLQRMTDAMQHRGPDGAGFHAEPGLALGHRRLAIDGLPGGVQPIGSPDGRAVLCFDGRIHRREALARALRATGHTARMRCDAEAVLLAWRAWGIDCLERLEGAFAFALWDRDGGQLLLARDRLGEKPLHYAALPDGSLAFASELGGLLALPLLPRRLDPAAIDDFLALGYVPDPHTIYAGIRRLPAGHLLLVRRPGCGVPPAPRRYWQPPTAAGPAPADAAAELAARLEDAVRARLLPGQPLGSFLSGGLGAAAVSAMAARGQPGLKTFTLGFPGPGDERDLAAATAARIGSTHLAEASGHNYLTAARQEAAVFGEPFGDHASVPALALCRQARRHVGVALSGDGVDEVFAGHRRYRYHQMAEAVRAWLPARLRRPVLGGLARFYPQLDAAPRWLRAQHGLTDIGLDSALGYYRTVCRLQQERRHALYSPLMRARVEGHDPAARFGVLMDECDPDAPLLQAQYADLHTCLPGAILTRLDRTGMAASLEVRPALLDPALVAWGMALPEGLKRRGGRGKLLLRQALAPHLPPQVLRAPQAGFAATIGSQLRAGTILMRRRLLGAPMLDCGLFERSALEALIDQHAEGRQDHSRALWQLLVLEGFMAKLGGLSATAMHDPVDA
jgi:asparagine synthase (glutamine-hydrolysing)